MTLQHLLYAVLALLALVVALLALALRRLSAVGAVGARLEAAEGAHERTERALRDELARSRAEGAAEAARLREEVSAALERLRGAVESRLDRIRDDNTRELAQVRATVDEKLQGVLEQRLGESFRQVSERLEQVHLGLGEMRTLAGGVGDLKKVLSNVKVRGGWGEVQLGRLLEQALAPEQYAANVATNEFTGHRVEYAIRLPGSGIGEVWLPVDAKFPLEDYQRLVEAHEAGDPEAAEAAGRQMEARLRACARDVCLKYLNPPRTTDFAILFLPTEGLYAEAVRRPGLVDDLQRESRVVVAGPVTFWAVLNSLQMGFRTLAIQQRSSEVWSVLGAVKTEFGKFGAVLEKVQKKLHEASRQMDQAGVRTRAIQRRLRGVEALSAAAAPSPPALPAAGEAGGRARHDLDPHAPE